MRLQSDKPALIIARQRDGREIADDVCLFRLGRLIWDFSQNWNLERADATDHARRNHAIRIANGIWNSAPRRIRFTFPKYLDHEALRGRCVPILTFAASPSTREDHWQLPGPLRWLTRGIVYVFECYGKSRVLSGEKRATWTTWRTWLLLRNCRCNRNSLDGQELLGADGNSSEWREKIRNMERTRSLPIRWLITLICGKFLCNFRTLYLVEYERWRCKRIEVRSDVTSLAWTVTNESCKSAGTTYPHVFNHADKPERRYTCRRFFFIVNCRCARLFEFHQRCWATLDDSIERVKVSRLILQPARPRIGCIIFSQNVA